MAKFLEQLTQPSWRKSPGFRNRSGAAALVQLTARGSDYREASRPSGQSDRVFARFATGAAVDIGIVIAGMGAAYATLGRTETTREVVMGAALLYVLALKSSVTH